jgi:hypothetical protein
VTEDSVVCQNDTDDGGVWFPVFGLFVLGNQWNTTLVWSWHGVCFLPDDNSKLVIGDPLSVIRNQEQEKRKEKKRRWHHDHTHVKLESVH